MLLAVLALVSGFGAAAGVTGPAPPAVPEPIDAVLNHAEPVEAVAPRVGEAVAAVIVEGVPDAGARAAALDLFGVAPGDDFDPARVRVGIKRVFLAGSWADVQVEASQLPAGVTLHLRLVPDVLLADVVAEVRGASPAKLRERILAAADLEVGSRFRQERVEAAVTRVRRALRELGFPRARVDPAIEELSSQARRVRLRIDAGPAAVVRELIFTGTAPLSRPAVEALLGVRAGVAFDRGRLEAGLEDARRLLVRRRYLAARAVVIAVQAQGSGEQVDVHVNLDAGPRYRVRFAGNVLLSDATLRTVLDEGKLGGVDRVSLARGRAAIENAYRLAGHARVRVASAARRAHRPHLDDADREIVFFVAEGPRAAVTSVVIEGARARPTSTLVAEVWASVGAGLPELGLIQASDPGDVDDLLASPVGRARAGTRPFEVSDEELQLLPRPAIERKTVYLEAAFAEAAQRIVDLYRADGFLDVRVEGPQAEFLDEGRQVRVRYVVREGERVIVRTVRFTDARRCGERSGPAPIAPGPGCADDPLPLEIMTAGLELKPGQPASFAGIAGARALVERNLQDGGYPRARVSEAFERVAPAAQVDVVFAVDPGPRVVIGKVRFRGNARTRELVLLDRMTLTTGDPYSASAVERSRQQLARLGLFSTVSVDLLDDRADARVRDLLVVLKERPQFALEVGAGASAEDGPRAFLAGEVRNIAGLGLGLRGRGQLNYPRAFYDFLYDPADPNNPLVRFPSEDNALIAWGRFFEGQAVVTGELPKVYGLALDTRLHVDVTAVREIRPAFTLNRASVLLGADIHPAPWLRLAPQVEAESSDFDCPKDLRFGQSCGEGSLGLTRRRDAGFIRQTTWRLSSSMDLRDNPVRPRLGTWFSTTADLALGSGELRVDQSARNNTAVSSDFIKLTAAAVGYLPLGRDFTWALSARAGNIFPLGVAYIPLFKRFYLGGTSSIRGFREDEILPADDPRRPAAAPRPVQSDGGAISVTRQSLGGQFVVSARSELRLTLAGDLELGTFLDLGELLEDATRFELSGVAVGAGVGLRYNTPVGPVAVDLGWRVIDGARALPPLHALDRLNLHLSMGYF